MRNLFELFQMLALPASVFLVCRYLNRRADRAALHTGAGQHSVRIHAGDVRGTYGVGTTSQVRRRPET